MHKELISGKQAVRMTFMMFSSVGIINLSNVLKTKQDTWIAIIMGAVLVLPLFMMYCRLLSLYPGEDFFQIIEHALGKGFGKLVIVVFLWYGLHIGAMVMCHTADYIQVSTIPETPDILIFIAIASVCAIGLKCGIEILARWAQLAFLCLMVFLAFDLPLSFTKSMDISNLRPLFASGWGGLMQSSLVYSMLPFGVAILFTPVLSSLQPEADSRKVMIKGLAISVVALVLISIRNILVLGIHNIGVVQFPSFRAADLINVANFITRIDVLIALYYLVVTLTLISICMFFVLRGIQRLFNLKGYRMLAAPVAFATMALGLTLYANSAEANEWLKIYAYYMFPFQVLLPLFIFIIAEIRVHHQVKKQKTQK